MGDDRLRLGLRLREMERVNGRGSFGFLLKGELEVGGVAAEGVGGGGEVGHAAGIDQGLKDVLAGLVLDVDEELAGDPFGGQAGVVVAEGGVEVGIDGGEGFKCVGGFALIVVGGGVEEAEAVAVFAGAEEAGGVDPVDELAEGERGAGGELGEAEGALVLVDDGVTEEAGFGAAGPEADDVLEGGGEDDASEFGFLGTVVGEVFSAEKGGVNAAEGAAFVVGEDVLGEAGLDLIEVTGGVEIADEATPVFALYVAEGGVKDGGVVPVGGGAEGVVDAPEAIGEEGTADGGVGRSGGGVGVLGAHGGDPFDAP